MIRTHRIALAFAFGLSAMAAGIPSQADVKPAVKDLLAKCTAAYSKLKSYHQVTVFKVDGSTPMGDVKRETKYLLALERPAKFCFKSVGADTVACVSDGATFINFNGKEYTKMKAPAAYKGINIVDDVLFQPLATYIIALMLQGDAMADKQVTSAYEEAAIEENVMDAGKKWTVLSVPFGQTGAPAKLYIDPSTHMVGKMVQKVGDGAVTTSETYEEVTTNKPIDAAVFKYTPPSSAKLVDKIPPPLGGSPQ